MPRLRAALARLNPGLPETVFERAMAERIRDRTKMVPAHANQDVYRLLKDGVKVEVPDERGGIATETVRLIAGRRPEADDFFLASQVKARFARGASGPRPRSWSSIGAAS